MEKRLHQLESFKAHGDDGRRYIVRGYEHLARVAGTTDIDGGWQPTGWCEYRLDTGEAVSVDKAGAMTIAGRGVRLQREASTAPA